jgi:hypothetical protein
MIQKTKPIPVIHNSLYNFSISLKGGQAEEASLAKSAKPGNAYLNNKYPSPTVGLIAHFTNTSDVIENSTKYGQNASAGRVLTLSPESQIYTNVDILKPANYTVALRANTCKESCSFLRVAIQNKDNNSIVRTETISLKQDANYTNTKSVSDEDKINNNSNNVKNKDYDSDKYNEGELKWVYLNRSVYLDQGKYEIKIYSGSKSKIDLDSVAVYSNNDNDNKNNSPSIFYADKKGNDTSDDVFSLKTESSPAYLAGYKKINPTKYEVKIENATRPYMMSLAETYDPLWMASYYYDTKDDVSDNSSSGGSSGSSSSNNNNNNNIKKIASIPLYSIINGFYINKTGDYTLTIEYEPQRWFIWAGIISITALILSVTFLYYKKKKCSGGSTLNDILVLYFISS